MRVLAGSGEGGAGGRVSGPHVALQQVGGRGGPLQPGGETRGAEQSLLHQHHEPFRLDLLLRISRYHLRSMYSVFSAIAKFTPFCVQVMPNGHLASLTLYLPPGMTPYKEAQEGVEAGTLLPL